MRIALLFISLLFLCLPAFCIEPMYSLGPLSHLSKYQEGEVYNGHFCTIIERGFKLQALMPERRDDNFMGVRRDCGFFTLEVDGKPLYTEFAQATDGTLTDLANNQHLIVSKVGPNQLQSAYFTAGYPFIWLVGLNATDDSAVTWLITGFDWANLPTPSECVYLPKDETQTKIFGRIGDDPAELTTGLGSPMILLRAPGQPVQLALFFTCSPRNISLQKDRIRLEMGEPQSGNKIDYPVMAAAILPATQSWEEAAKLIPFALATPEENSQTFGMTDGKPWIELGAKVSTLKNEWEINGLSALAVPPSLTSLVTGDVIKLPTLFGEAALVTGEKLKIDLPQVPNLEQLLPPQVEMSAEWQQKMDKLAADICDHLRPQGGFTSSLGRPFYDGLTLTGLMSARRYLSEPIKVRVDEATKRTLNLWWKNLRLDGEVGIWYFPEPAPMIPVVDYPEITGVLLWPTVLYASQVDPQYPVQIASEIVKLATTLPKAYDWTGAAFAYAGPEFHHVITESVIGGFETWVSLYHLTKMADIMNPDEFAARASFANEAMKLMTWRPEYGTVGTVNEYMPDRIKTSLHDAWCYTMFTWFSYLPQLELPKEDVYNVWRTLDEQKWWDYSIKSRQRCYDYAHVMAIARYRSIDEAMTRLAEFDDRPYEYDSFDPTPAYTLMAYPWLMSLRTN